MKPISVIVKIRQGRKACTLLSGFEPFGLQADDLAEELRKTCASSTSGTSTLLAVRSKFTSVSDHIRNPLPQLHSYPHPQWTVSPVHGKPNALEVMVQGKQIKAVTDMLVARGVPKRWIESSDQSEQKKKK